jgi:hypothetical protein
VRDYAVAATITLRELMQRYLAEVVPRHEADRDAWMLEVRQMIVTRLEDRNIKNE